MADWTTRLLREALNKAGAAVAAETELGERVWTEPGGRRGHVGGGVLTITGGGKPTLRHEIVGVDLAALC
jgi:hypothetical protein